MTPPERMASLQADWLGLLARYNVQPAAAIPIFDRLTAAYSEPARCYHNLEHLSEMLQIARRLAPETQDPAAVELAIWFHDAIYDSRAKDNEIRSAGLARELLAPVGVPAEVIARVRELILVTAHLTSAAPPPDSETATILDADLAILGAAPERYMRYARDIRIEYNWVPETDYRTGRSAVLNAFLARPRLFHHRVTFKEGEERARANIRGELKALGG